MSAEILAIVVFAVAYLVLFAGAEVLHVRLGWSSEWSRKFIHVSGGLLSLLLPVFLQYSWSVLLLGVAFIGLLAVTRRMGLLNSVHRVKRRSVGSVIFPIPVYLCFALAEWQGQWAYFYIPLLVLTLSDPLAAIVGTRWPWLPYEIGGHRKTGAGSLAYAASALLIGLLCLPHYFGPGVVALLGWSLLLAVVTTLCEAVSGDGYDNITAPMAAAVVVFLIQQV